MGKTHTFGVRSKHFWCLCLSRAYRKSCVFLSRAPTRAPVSPSTTFVKIKGEKIREQAPSSRKQQLYRGEQNKAWMPGLHSLPWPGLTPLHSHTGLVPTEVWLCAACQHNWMRPLRASWNHRGHSWPGP